MAAPRASPTRGGGMRCSRFGIAGDASTALVRLAPALALRGRRVRAVLLRDGAHFPACLRLFLHPLLVDRPQRLRGLRVEAAVDIVGRVLEIIEVLRLFPHAGIPPCAAA